jgi:hypothetical protein
VLGKAFFFEKKKQKTFSGCRGLYGRGWFFGARNTVNFLLRHRREVAQLRDLNVTVEGDKTVHFIPWAGLPP